MVGEVDVYIETEHTGTKYDGKHYFKCTGYNYVLNHIMKFYDLGMIAVLADTLGWNMSLSTLCVDFGKHTESWNIEFIYNDISLDENERRFWEMIKFARFKAAFASNCYLYIGDYIVADDTRYNDDSGKGIKGKIANINARCNVKEGYIKGMLTFLICRDLLGF